MTKNEYIRAFRMTRLIIYLVLICLCVLFTYFKPFYYLCDYGEVNCIFCGMRSAVKAIMQFRIVEAYKYNKYIVFVQIVTLGILLDTVRIWRAES